MTRLASAIVGLLTTALLITGCAMLRALAVAQEAVTVLDALAVTPGGAAIAGEVVLATPLGPLSGGVPEHTVAFLAALTCPDGWVAHAAAQGRYVVGVHDGGTLAETVGTALTNREARSSGSHAHSFSDSDTISFSHAHSFSDSDTISFSHTHGFSDSDTISFAHTHSFSDNINHTHSFSDNINHTHSFSDTDSIAHNHGFSTRTGGTTANHTHGYDRTGASTRSGSGSGSAAISALQFDDQTSNGASQTHQHDLSGTTGSGGGTVSISGTTGGGGGTDTVSISGTTTSGGGSATVDISGTTGSGGSSSTPAPYVQLLACRRVLSP